MLERIIFTRPGHRLLIILTALTAASLSLFGIFQQKRFVDHLFNVQATTLEFAFATLGLAFVCVVASQIFSQLSIFLGTRESSISQEGLGRELYSKVLRLKGTDLAGHTSGELIAAYATDVPGSTGILDQTLPTGALSIFPLLLAPWALSEFFALPVLPLATVIAISVLITALLSGRQSRFFTRFKMLAAERVGMVSEWIQNVRVLRILGWTEPFEQRILSKREEETRNRLRMVTNGQLMSGVSSSITFFINLFGVWLLLRQRGQAITPGELFALLWMLGVFLNRPFRHVPWLITFYLDSRSSYRRFDLIMSIPERAPEFSREDAAKPADCPACALEIRGLTLSAQGEKLLDDVSFTVAEGEFVAVVGKVGAGKTLLLQSLMGETSAAFRAYRIAGQNASTMKFTELRRHFSLVPQDGFVMSASVLENVLFRYNDPEAAEHVHARVEACLQSAQIDFSEDRLPDGLGTEIGERGVNLSGGQKQRIAIARSVHFDRPIFLLDDALSAVDVGVEKLLMETLLMGALAGRTRILTTHRLSVLPFVDRVLYLDQGRLVADGKYTELLANHSEFRGFIETLEQEDD